MHDFINHYGFWGIVFGTLILEDVVLTGSIVMVSTGTLPYHEAFLANFVGICLGDLGLYFMGVLINKINFFQQKFPKITKKIEMISYQNMTISVFLCRFVPGTRVPTYIGSGFKRYSFLNFLFITLVSVLAWVYLTFLVGESLTSFIKHDLFWFIISFLVILYIFRKALALYTSKWKRKSFVFAWNRWRYFEFWPALLFYIPVVLYYFYLSVIYRGLFYPMCSNPLIRNGGLVGEEKWDFYKHLKKNTDFYLKTILVKDTPQKFHEIQDLISRGEFQFPFILKPNIGQRGYGVRLIHNANELIAYTDNSHFDLIVQEYADSQCEAGVLYYRKPDEAHGRIFSITDKKFPFVVGDGETCLGQLILNDVRARIIAATYFARFQNQLDQIPAQNEVIPLVTAGNHCQGAIFKNGQDMITEELLHCIEKIAFEIPEFYFGRFDIRYHSVADLKKGLNYKVIEVNGAGAEATHIWDAKEKLVSAYATLFRQWRILFEIGRMNRNKVLVRPNLVSFILDYSRQLRQDKSLSVSS